MSRSQQLQNDVDSLMRESRELTQKQHRYMEDSRVVGEDLQRVSTKLVQRQRELADALRQEAEEARHK